MGDFLFELIFISMKQVIRLTEQDLARIVKRVINEANTKDPVCVSGDCKNGIGELKYSSGETYKGQFKNGEYSGYGVLKINTGGIYKGQFTDATYGGYGIFTNKHGRVFTGTWDNLGTGPHSRRYRVPAETENIQYGFRDLERLEDIKKGQNVNVQNCIKPDDSRNWARSASDKNYEYYNNEFDMEGEHCWWARNINNGKIFNLTKLSQTNPKILKSLVKLNKEYQHKYNT